MMKTKLLAVLLFFPLWMYSQSLQLTAGEVEAVADTAALTFYLTVSDRSAQTVTVTYTPSATQNPDRVSILWNGKSISLGVPFSVKPDFSKPQTLTVTERTGNVSHTQRVKVEFTLLPIVSIDILPGEVVGKVETARATFTLTDAQKRTEGRPVLKSAATVHYRGNTSLKFDKKSYAVKLTTDDYTTDAEHDVMGIRLSENWILDAMVVDAARMRNRLCFDVWNDWCGRRDDDMVRPGTKGYFVEVMLNGKYHGLYCLSDKVNRKQQGIKKMRQAADGSPAYRGLLYKCQRADDPSHFLVLPDNYDSGLQGISWFSWDLKYPDTHPSEQAWKPLIDLMAYTGTAPEKPEEGFSNLEKHFYIQNAIDFPLFAMTFMLLDNAMHNTYLSFKNVENDRRAWITPWDMDGSFGCDGLGQHLQWVAIPIVTVQDTQPFRTWMDDHSSPYFALMCKRWAELSTGLLRPDEINRRIDVYADLLSGSGAWRRERSRWTGILPDLSETVDTETDYMKTWYANNYAHLCSYFVPVTQNIDQITVGDGMDADATVYDLGGRHCGKFKDWKKNPQKGVYIIGNRRVFIK